MARLFGVCQSYHAERLLETRMKRITFLIAVAFGLAISSASFAQTVVDVVYLKNGSVIRGTIVEQVPGESLKVQTADGSIFVYTLDEVEKMTKEEVEEEEVSRPTGSKKYPVVALGLSLGVPIVSYKLLGWAIDDISTYLEPAANSVSLDLAPEGKGRGWMLSFTHRR